MRARQAQSPGHAAWLFGRELRRLRRARGWSQRRLAAEAHINQSTVSRLEHGRLPFTTIQTVSRVLVAMDDGQGVLLRLAARDAAASDGR